MYARTIVVGRVGGEVKTFTGATNVAKFSVATDSGFGEKKKTEWYNVTAFGKTADACTKFLSKGKVVVVEGRMETSEGKDGKKYVSLLADRVQFLPDGGAKGERASKPATDDDLPF